jgi:hypothetical protein
MIKKINNFIEKNYKIIILLKKNSEKVNDVKWD